VREIKLDSSENFLKKNENSDKNLNKKAVRKRIEKKTNLCWLIEFEIV